MPIVFCPGGLFQQLLLALYSLSSLEKIRSVESLVAEFNKQVGSRAWTSLRGLHDSVLIDTLIEKGVDVSAVYDGVEISFKRKIALDKDKNSIIFV